MYGEIKPGVKAPYNTIFNVASLTKPVTSMVTLKLVSMGDWDLDNPLHRYWIDPDIKPDPRHLKLTTRHVLMHTTGFKNWRRMEADGKLKINFDPGTQYQYSGEVFQYLKRALENKFNKSLDELAKSILFSPLKMSDTRFIWDEKMNESRFALWFDQTRHFISMTKGKEPTPLMI